MKMRAVQIRAAQRWKRVSSSISSVMKKLARAENWWCGLTNGCPRLSATIEKELRRMETTEASISKRTDEQERRIVLLESALERLRGDVGEIKADVKSLLRSSVE